MRYTVDDEFDQVMPGVMDPRVLAKRDQFRHSGPIAGLQLDLVGLEYLGTCAAVPLDEVDPQVEGKAAAHLRNRRHATARAFALGRPDNGAGRLATGADRVHDP